MVLATITTTRKFFTILASVVAFGHALTMPQWLGVALLFGGMVEELRTEYRKTTKARATMSWTRNGPASLSPDSAEGSKDK